MGDHHLRKNINLRIYINWGGKKTRFHNDLHDVKLQYLHMWRILAYILGSANVCT